MLYGQVASGVDQLQLELDWIYSTDTTCYAQAETTTGLTPVGGCWSATSPAVITSEFDGAPWSCLQARLYSTGRRCELKLYTDWRSDCQSGPGEANTDGGWSPYVVIGEWHSGNMACLSVNIDCL